MFYIHLLTVGPCPCYSGNDCPRAQTFETEAEAIAWRGNQGGEIRELAAPRKFKITANGKTYKFATLEEANATAQRVFEETGDIVGIEYA